MKNKIQEKNSNLRNELTQSLIKMYKLDFVNCFIDFLQGENAVLLALLLCKKLSPSELSKRTSLTKSRISAILTSLLKKEFIKVELDEKDRRKFNASLDEKGKLHIAKKEKNILSLIDKFIEKMGKENTEKLIQLINRMSECMISIEIK